MKQRILGIDPGQSGGAAIVEFDTSGQPSLASYMRMPIIQEGKRKLVDTRALTAGLLYPDQVTMVVIERVNSMPRQGVASSFTFGRHTGAVEGWALAMGKPVHWASPSTWKRALGLSSDKRASLDLARLHFGNIENLWGVLANDGIAEAALMCIWVADKLRQRH